MTKSGREIVEIFEAFDLTGTAWSAAQLTGCDAKTVTRYVAVREAGGDPLGRAARPRLIGAFMTKIEELVDRSKGKIRADVAHRKITAMGYRGSERSTRRAVAEVKEAWRAGRRRRYRPWSRSRDVAAAGLGRWPADRRVEDPAVLGVAGLVAVPGGDPRLGPAARHADLVPGPGAAAGSLGHCILKA